MEYINKILQGDCVEVMKTMPDNSVDAVVTDPPYGLEFMGKNWDKFKAGKNIAGGNTGENTPYARSKPAPAFYQLTHIDKLSFQEFSYNWSTEALRVLKPGGYLLAFGGTRTYHRLVCGIEDAGFEIRDTIAWVYGSGFPKSLDISKAIDKRAGKEREIIGKNINARKSCGNINICKKNGSGNITASATPEALQWQGWGTALKPSFEPIVVARKPLSEKTVAENVLKWGTGGINVDGGRIGYSETNKPIPQLAQGKTEIKTDNKMYGRNSFNESKTKSIIGGSLKGRFPANLIHDGSPEVLAGFPNVKSGKIKPYIEKPQNPSSFNFIGRKKPAFDYNDSGSAARFFYCAKSSKQERNRGCEGLELKSIDIQQPHNSKNLEERYSMTSKNNHPTVKPIALMKYLVKLVTQPNGIVLDPFTGSGSTLIACKESGFNYIGIEKEEEYIKIAECRIRAIPETLF